MLSKLFGKKKIAAPEPLHGGFTIPVARPDHSGNEAAYLQEAIAGGWTSSAGPFVKRFEEAFAAYVGTRFAVACSSGTAALVLALRALGVKRGDEVIVPQFTMIASAWAVTMIGATPVFVDCGDDLNIDVTKLEEALTSRTKAIMPVHIYGRPAAMQKVLEFARKYDLFVIEDAAEAHGAQTEADGVMRMVGSIGDIGCFSLYANKIITSGEGGVCTTNDPALYEEMVKLRGMYFNEKHTFLHPKLGYNFRMTNLQAAVACAQLERIVEFLARRHEIAQLYDEHLDGVVERIPRPAGSVVWMYDILAPDLETRDRWRKKLEDHGIETRVFFKPMSQQPMYKRHDYTRLNAQRFAKIGLYLPTFTQLTNDEITLVCRALKR